MICPLSYVLAQVLWMSEKCSRKKDKLTFTRDLEEIHCHLFDPSMAQSLYVEVMLWNQKFYYLHLILVQ